MNSSEQERLLRSIRSSSPIEIPIIEINRIGNDVKRVGNVVCRGRGLNIRNFFPDWQNIAEITGRG